MSSQDQLLSSNGCGGPAIGLSTHEYDQLLVLVKEKTGIHLGPDKHTMIRRRLSVRLRERGIKSYADYCDLIRSGDKDELEHFSNAVTTNLTAFFREAHHFDLLAKDILPRLVSCARNTGNKIRIWCAGCSTGEEPYSVAILIQELAVSTEGLDIKVLGTDIDTTALDQCRRGIYAEERVAAMSEERLKRWFSRGKGANEGFVKVSQALKELVAFRPLNLMHSWPMSGAFDLILCRNVIIYFDKKTQETLADRFANVLKPGGHLFLGHSESLLNVTDRFSLLGQSVYEGNLA